MRKLILLLAFLPGFAAAQGFIAPTAFSRACSEGRCALQQPNIHDTRLLSRTGPAAVAHGQQRRCMTPFAKVATPIAFAGTGAAFGVLATIGKALYTFREQDNRIVIGAGVVGLTLGIANSALTPTCSDSASTS